ncbi:MAG: hypothetical protein ABL984_03255 [Pyrinomonadaceae bacterium]
MATPENETTSLAKIYPHLSEEELREAEENLMQYLAVVRRIFDRIKRENPKVLTDLRRRANVRKETALT